MYIPPCRKNGRPVGFNLVRNRPSLAINVLLGTMYIEKSIRGIFSMQHKIVTVNIASYNAAKGTEANVTRYWGVRWLEMDKKNTPRFQGQTSSLFQLNRITSSRRSVQMWSNDHKNDTEGNAGRHEGYFPEVYMRFVQVAPLENR